MPSSITNEILEQLLTSLHNKFQDDLVLSQESSSFVYKSVEECNIHFHKIDLRRGASFIESPQWLQHKKATINPQNSNDTYCFMYAIAIALFHEALGKNPGRISKQLIEYANAFNWHDIDFPASYDDYVTFERLNDIVALIILYVPFNQINICPAYISARNFDEKHQVVLLKKVMIQVNGIFWRFQVILMKMVIKDQKRVYQDYWKVYHPKVMMIFIATDAYTLFAVKQH